MTPRENVVRSASMLAAALVMSITTVSGHPWLGVILVLLFALVYFASAVAARYRGEPL